MVGAHLEHIPRPDSRRQAARWRRAASALLGGLLLLACGDPPIQRAKGMLKVEGDLVGDGAARGLAFGPLCLHGQRSRSLTLVNQGNGSISIQALEVSPPFTARTSANQLAAGGKATLEITFQPTQVGPDANGRTLTIRSTGGDVALALSGDGYDGPREPRLHMVCFNGSDIRDGCGNAQIFQPGPVRLGSEARWRLRLFNDGCPDLAIQGLAVLDENGAESPQAPFRVEALAPPATTIRAGADLPVTLNGFPPGADPTGFSREWDIVLAPVLREHIDLSLHYLEVRSSDPRVAPRITMLGSVAFPDLFVDPPFADFEGVAGRDLREFFVENHGNQALTVSAITASASPFQPVVPVPLPFTLAPETRQRIEVRYLPSVELGCKRDQETLAVASDAGESRVRLQGGGIPRVTTAPESIWFQSIDNEDASGIKQLTIVNEGDRTVSVEGVEVSESQPAESWRLTGSRPDFPLRLAPGQTLPLEVTFRDEPKNRNETGEVRVRFSAPDCAELTPVRVALDADSMLDLDPTADIAIRPAEPRVGQEVVLDGGGSTDPEGMALTFDWQVYRSDTLIFQGTEQAARFVPTDPGQYRVYLVVKDPRGFDGEAQTSMQVLP
jgi:hypothetical protein